LGILKIIRLPIGYSENNPPVGDSENNPPVGDSGNNKIIPHQIKIIPPGLLLVRKYYEGITNSNMNLGIPS
jgi:hypothetical protein